MSISTETTILRALIEKENGFVSGSILARSLDMSRVAVWQHMEKMRRHGFEFDAVRARGYRLTKRPNAVYPDLIHAYLSSRKLAFDLIFNEEIDSTNDEAARQLAAGREAPFIVVATKQTKGRGRFGRVWHSEANGNLYISFAFRPQLEPARMQTFTLWMGINLCELIANFTRTTPGLKWPNDILFDGRKAGGILTEARIDSDQIRDLVFGLGLNLNSDSDSWPAALTKRAISLAEHTNTPLDINKFTAALIGRVLDAYDQFVSGAYQKTFADRWHEYDILRGKSIKLLHGSETISGTASGIDDEGSLIVKTDKGRTERFRAGEVTIEKK
ncbi:biotin--[acetyl-CoA-carboxylase] ligase [Nibricoccus aquaticus]|uniref:Bifunctional ligase/repressor BirA n=1 Tax=Nibricoccus aquaticus TaxID=2576891 RepID=A0A290QH22_9BACT|nr:biotin--[acetyl-CoA-carboxylase] ligase [Nibricoccus aquaticus]ATC63172.1 biotin--[acetyl-CoA-carboxylase] ligase [Nibricoccus aquaticus]